MTFLFERIKVRVPQTIAVTHHPHLIFSRLVDSIWYLEVTPDDYTVPDHETYAGSPSLRSTPLSTVLVSAETDMEKLVTSYKLFDQWDSNLLRLSQSIVHHVTDAFVAALKPIAANRVVAPSPRSRRDVQADVLADKVNAILNRFTGKEPRFLDYGAGRGRVLKELIKEDSGFWTATSWSLWEPDTLLRKELLTTFGTEKFKNVEVLKRPPNRRNRYHVILAVNVIHELSPIEFASMLTAIWFNLDPSGSVFFVELFPLLEVERLAVPYERNDLHDLLRSIGWRTEDDALNIRNASVSAYWLRAEKDRAQCCSESEMRKQIEQLWQRILKRCCGSYTARQVGHSGTQVASLIGDWATIASIQSYFTGNWRYPNTSSENRPK